MLPNHWHATQSLACYPIAGIWHSAQSLTCYPITDVLTVVTRVWNGEATSLDAVWEDLPMLSIAGAHISNRFGMTSMLSLGMGSEVVTTLKQLEDRGHQLTSDGQSNDQ